MASSTSAVPNSVIPATVNPDLQKERDGASFSSEEFAAWWSGGEEILKFNRGVRKSIKLITTLIS